MLPEMAVSNLFEGIGCSYGGDRNSFFIGLFWPDDPPPEHQSFITLSEVNKLLGSIGYEPKPPEPEPTEQ